MKQPKFRNWQRSFVAAICLIVVVQRTPALFAWQAGDGTNTTPMEAVHTGNRLVHMWDYESPDTALQVAQRRGQAARCIRLKQYEQAIGHQELSARMDLKYMMRDRMMPDQVLGFAHQYQWLIRNLINTGRAQEAANLSMEMIGWPRHPEYNRPGKHDCSSTYGPQRLFQTLREFQWWEQAIELCQSSLLHPAAGELDEVARLRLLGCAAAMTGQTELQNRTLSELAAMLEDKRTILSGLRRMIARREARIDGLQGTQRTPEQEASLRQYRADLLQDNKKLFDANHALAQIEQAIVAISGYELVSKGDWKAAHAKLTAATAEDAGWLGELLFLSGAQTDGLEIVQDHAKRRGNEVVPLARLAYLQYESGDLAGAQQSLQRINNASSKIDWAIPLFARLRPAMENAGHEESVPGLATTVGLLNSSDDVMPRWEPARAPTWQLVDSEDRTVDSSDYNGRAHLLIFYLGHGCLHCVQQLQALGPREPEFRAAGVEMIAISIESHDNLKESVQALGSQMPIRLMSNPLLDVFRSHGAFDAGEQKPLHGTFLIDSHGLIRWQDIRTEPFMDIDFLLAEARRLL